MITFEEFKDYIETIQKFDKYLSDISAFGIDLYETPIQSLFYKLQCKYENIVFTEQIKDWIDWWLYERPGMDNDVIDRNGNNISSETIEDLWNIINNKEL